MGLVGMLAIKYLLAGGEDSVVALAVVSAFFVAVSDVEAIKSVDVSGEAFRVDDSDSSAGRAAIPSTSDKAINKSFQFMMTAKERETRATMSFYYLTAAAFSTNYHHMLIRLYCSKSKKQSEFLTLELI